MTNRNVLLVALLNMAVFLAMEVKAQVKTSCCKIDYRALTDSNVYIAAMDFFGNGSSILNDQARVCLKQLSQFLRGCGEDCVILYELNDIGYDDKDLTKVRCASVRNYLVRCGLPKNRIWDRSLSSHVMMIPIPPNGMPPAPASDYFEFAMVKYKTH